MFKLWFDAPCLKYACKINMHLYSREGSGWTNILMETYKWRKKCEHCMRS